MTGSSPTALSLRKIVIMKPMPSCFFEKTCVNRELIYFLSWKGTIV